MTDVFLSSISLEDLERVIEITVKKALSESRQNSVDASGVTWLDLTSLCEYLPEKPVKATVYSWVSRRLIPFHKKSKKLFFLRSEIDAWLKSGRRKTASEIAGSDGQIKKGGYK